MKIHFLGDVHGRWTSLHEALERVKADHIIQVGDMGFFPALDCLPPRSIVEGRPFSFVDGNHDDLTWIRANPYQNLTHLDRGTRHDFVGADGTVVNVATLGGGESIDKAYRKPFVSWFPNEEPTGAEVHKLLTMEPLPNVVVTHEAPACLHHNYRGSDTARALDCVAEDFNPRVAKGKPLLWVFGHHHRWLMDIMKTFNNIIFAGLPAIHHTDDGGNGSLGLTVEFRHDGTPLILTDHPADISNTRTLW